MKLFDLNNEVRDMQNAGVFFVDPEYLEKLLDDLGYKIDDEDSFDYLNTSNKNTYPARSISIVAKDNGMSFANVVNTKRPALAPLQHLRLNVAVCHKNRIWEL